MIKIPDKPDPDLFLYGIAGFTFKNRREEIITLGTQAIAIVGFIVIIYTIVSYSLTS